MKPERVLVTDDDEILLRLMVAYLQRSGYEVASAKDAYAALEMLQGHGPFTVLVTDITMPGMSGLELLREARQLDPQLEVIVVSAASTAESAIAAMREGGAYNYLVKPFEMMSELSLAVERAAEHRRLQLERESLRGELRTEADHLQTLLAHTGEAILSADAQGRLCVVNLRAARLIGRDDLVGREAQACLPPPLVTLLAKWQAVGDHSPALMELPWSVDTTYLVRLIPFRDGKGSPAGWMMVVGDTTPLKRQAEFKMQLFKKIASKIQFPLTQAMFTLTEFKEGAQIKGKRSAESYYRLAHLLNLIREATEELLAGVQANAEASPRLTPVDLCALVEELLQSLPNRLIRDKELTVEVSLADNLPPVQADPKLLHRLLGRLAHRAIVRSQPGASVRLSACAYQDQVWIKVRDAGPAVAEADLTHLFEKSFAGSNLDGEDGAGLELPLVKTGVDRMGGQVWLGGEGPLGSSLILSLPALAPASAPLEPHPEKVEPDRPLKQPEVSSHAVA